MAAAQAAVATAANHFAALNDASQEIYFTCMLYKMSRQIEIAPGSWAETLPSFSVIEVRKRSKCDSSTRAVRDQAVVSGPRPPPANQWTPQALAEAITSLLFLSALWCFYFWVLLK